MTNTEQTQAGEGTQIKRAYVRTYSDNGQVTAYVEWSDGSRTEGSPTGSHMLALMSRFVREGGVVEQETW